MTRQTRLIRLPDGTPVWARIDPGGDGASDAGETHGGELPTASGDHGSGGSYDSDGSYDSYDSGNSHDSGNSGDSGDSYDDYQDVGALDGALARVSRLREVITGVAASVRDAAERAAPDEIGVEFGVEFAVRGGAIVSVLADAETTGTLKVTLTWKDRLGRTAPPPQPPLPVPPPAAPPHVPSGGGGDV